MKLWKWISRSSSPLSLEEYANFFNFNGLTYPFGGGSQTLGQTREEIGGDYVGIVQGAYKSNGVVFACMLARMLLFSEVRFQYRRRRNGRANELFGTSDLSLLETPWPNGTTGDLLTRIIQDVDLSGNFFGARRGNRIKRLRPDWVTIVMGSESDPEATAEDLDVEVIGYVYQPGGPMSDQEPVVLFPREVAHVAPIPDPLASFRGMPWITPVLREIMGDSAATTHKLKFFENGATPNMVVSLDANVKQEAFERWIKLFEEGHEGVANAYKTLYLGGGANVEVVGTDLRRIDFKAVQGGGETRIAAAAGVPPVIVGLSEGLEAATYSNYGQARRRFADGTMRPLWRNVAGALSTLVPVPDDAELWYDERDVAFLQEDRQDEADIQLREATTIRQLVEVGYEPASVIAAVEANDLTLLNHTGLFSVQLQPPNSDSPNDNGQQQEAGRQVLAGLLERPSKE